MMDCVQCLPDETDEKAYLDHVSEVIFEEATGDTTLGECMQKT
jgi:hypothetical protein